MKTKFFKILLIAIAALLIAAPVMAGIGGSGISGIQIQNLDTVAEAKVIVQLYNQNGTAPVTVSVAGGDPIAKGAAKNYYMPSLTGVNAGAYAMVVSSASPISAIVRTDWSSTGGAALYGSVDPGTNILVPLVTYQFGGQNSQITIQNTDTVNELDGVQVVLYGRGLVSQVTSKTINDIPKGSSMTFDVTPAFFGLTSFPNTGVDIGVSTGFVGSMRITAGTAVVVQSFIDIAGTRGVTGFVGVDSASAATTLYCPLIRANYYGDTGISIVNPGAATTGTITFYSDANSPSKGTFTQAFSVGANSSFVAFQGPTGNSRSAPTNLPGGSQTGANPTPTNNGFYGVAKIVANGPVLAVVNDTLFGSGWSVQAQSTYNCVGISGAGSRFALPLVRRFHVNSVRLTTGIQIQNTCANAVSIDLDIYNWDGTRQSSSDPAPISVPANGSGNYWNGSLANLPTVPVSAGGFGWYGSALLTATPVTGTCANVVVVVSDENGPSATTKVDSANYNGLIIP
jgi:hypothetical protein